MNTFSFSPLSLQECRLDEATIDVWQFPLVILPTKAWALLSEEEQIRANRFHFEKHRRRFIIARAQVRFLLGLYLKIDARDIVFSYGKYGKPEVSSAAIQFNVSHSQDVALVAIGKTYPLGIDIEFFSQRPYAGIAKHVFSPEEIQAFSSLDTSMQALGFFHIWAQKEALIKASGLGLSYPLERTCLPILPQTAGPIWDPLHQKTWQLFSFMPEVACCAALCFATEVQKLRKKNLTVSELLYV